MKLSMNKFQKLCYASLTSFMLSSCAQEVKLENILTQDIDGDGKKEVFYLERTSRQGLFSLGDIGEVCEMRYIDGRCVRVDSLGNYYTDKTQIVRAQQRAPFATLPPENQRAKHTERKFSFGTYLDSNRISLKVETKDYY